MPGDHLFVYGTLRRGSNNKFARLLAEKAQFVGTARVPGRLYDFGRYPGAKRAEDPGESIVGEIFRLDDPGAILPALDEYEGPEFERALVSITDARECWIYWYIGDDAGRRIPSGDWFHR